jgi:dienelactone hydrolase
MNTEDVVIITVDARPMRAYLAWPPGAHALRPAIVLGELFGLNAITGEADAMVPLDDVAMVRRWFTAAGADLDVVTYPNVGHRFCAEGRPGYDAAAAADAWRRVAAHLGANHFTTGDVNA